MYVEESEHLCGREGRTGPGLHVTYHELRTACCKIQGTGYEVHPTNC